MALDKRHWVHAAAEARVQDIAAQVSIQSTSVLARLDALVVENRDIHEKACFNLNPATNVMNPRAEAILASVIGSRPSLGYPGDKYEMGLEAIEEIEVICATLCAEVFDAKFAEIRAPSGAIAFPGMAANFDAAKSAALAVTMLDWCDHGQAYAAKMIQVAQGLAAALAARGVPVFETAQGATSSHQFTVRAAQYGGGQTASKKLRKAGFLACGIGLPIEEIAGDMNGLRIGTTELGRWGVDMCHVSQLADLVAQALDGNDPSAMAKQVRDWRETFDTLHYVG